MQGWSIYLKIVNSSNSLSSSDLFIFFFEIIFIARSILVALWFTKHTVPKPPILIIWGEYSLDQSNPNFFLLYKFF